MSLVINSLGCRRTHTHTHTHMHTHTNTHTDDPHRINFMKPGARRPMASARLVLKAFWPCKAIPRWPQFLLCHILWFITTGLRRHNTVSVADSKNSVSSFYEFIVKLDRYHFLNQASCGRRAPGFLKLILCRLSVCVRACVCVCVRAQGY